MPLPLSVLVILRVTRGTPSTTTEDSPNEQSSLLSEETTATATEPLTTRFPKSLKFLTVLIAVITLAELIIDFANILEWIEISVIFHEPAKMVADLIYLFGWVFVCGMIFLWDRGVELRVRGVGVRNGGVNWIWSVAMVTVLVDLYQWIVIGYYTSTGDFPALTTTDGFYLAAFVLRLLLVTPSVIISWVLPPTTQNDVETSTNDTNTGESSWISSIRRVRTLFPYLWPRTWYLRFLVFCCMGLLILGRIVNFLVPYQYKTVVDSLTPKGSEIVKDFLSDGRKFAWGSILLFVFLRFLQGGVGLISTITSMLWIPVAQYTTREISVQMLRHLHSLSLQYHLTRKTGEVLRVMDRGTNSIGSLLSYLLFNIIPVVVDIVVAVLVFLTTFDVWLSLIVLTTMTLYIIATILITEWRTSFRKEMIELDNKTRSRSVDSLLNFETVKYYNAEEWEVGKYEQSLREYMKADWVSSASMNLLNSVQNLIIQLGLLAGSLLCAKRVVEDELTVGGFIFFLTYLGQLYAPLNWLGTYYRVIQQSFIDMEQMLDLFKVSRGVEDKPDAKTLDIKGGTITFESVGFSYDDRKTTIQDISFTVPEGKTVALVGESGSGKSTVFRLLFRFYDVKKGRILIDGQDVRDVTQYSLRKSIGVVPQDTVLFNNDVRYNIRYGNVNATDEEVEEAAKAAQIHERILAFPDKYETKVGERGLRLSGGEKQRVAIARTILKAPTILLLDEATSALDTTTERSVQSALKALSANRTTLVIAHRLSTIVDADEIIVMSNGRIQERGTHESLMKIDGGIYCSMWNKQLENQKQEEQRALENAGKEKEN
ncbi:Homocysteine S-methyltransferase 1 [Nowakowskiella sp. JEL0407]|nr:Homocysteine S-methyltransferase 1 [Nowakowskiella sp. JEL0407]